MATPTLANCIARRIGCYELVEEMKRKPGLAVYKAVDVRSGQLAVLKTMQGGQLAEREAHRLREAMGREAATLGRLRHPGIVRLLDRADDEAGNPYLVMEYVAGGTLEQALGPDCLGEPVGLAPRLRIAIQVAVALDYLHRRGVVHRDIKPCNILLTERREPRIADFGIATLIENGHSPGGSLPGTPSFVAPELLEDAPPSPRSDIFSFGVLFYWMLTGKIPFDGESVTEIIDRVRRLEPLSVVRHNWALPRELDAVLARCLAKDPAARYGSAGEIASDLTQLLAASRSSASDRHPAPLPAAELPAAGQKVQPIRLPLPAGPQEPAAADSISRAALACHRQGRHAEAERLYCEALRLRRQAFGPCHPQVATTLNNLAMLYSEQGRTELARRLLECSLVIAEKLFGPDHPKTALRRRNLAALRPAKSA